jgi:outer membrane protein assembly factor BamC
MKTLRHSVVVAILFAVALGGCSTSGSKSDQSPAKMREALEVPPDLARPAGDDLTAGVPAAAPAPANGGRGAASAAATPAVANGGKAEAPVAPAGKVRIERDGAQRWLVVQDTREHVWLTVRDHFLKNEIKLGVDDPQAGVLETVWLDRREELGGGVLGKLLSGLRSTGLRDKYRVRIEAGRVAGTTEVYVSHQGLEEVVLSEGGASGVVQTTWQPRPSDPEREADLLGKLVASLGGDAQPVKAGEAAASDRAQRVKDTLVLPQDDLDDAWRRVGLALDRAGIVVEDRDRSAGIYYVRYVASGAAAKKAIVFPWETGAGDAKDDGSQNRFQVALKAQGTGTVVSVRDVKGQPDDSKPGERLLTLLHQQLR